MSIEDKLDQIIELLTWIDAKLSSQAEPDKPVVNAIVSPKPTKSMLEFQRRIEFAARMARKYFLTAIRQEATTSGEVRRFTFTPQFIPRIDEKIKKTGAQFYRDLKIWSENYVRAVEAEGEKTQQRAVDRLKARKS